MLRWSRKLPVAVECPPTVLFFCGVVVRCATIFPPVLHAIALHRSCTNQKYFFYLLLFYGSTLEAVLEKNKQETTNLDADCVARKGAYASAWQDAQDHYTSEEPKVDVDEQAKYLLKETSADTALDKVNRAQDGLVLAASILQTKKQGVFDDKEREYNTAVSNHASARVSAAAEEENYADVTTPAQRALNLGTFNTAKALIDTEKKDTIAAATLAKTTGTDTCESITNARKAHVDADDALLSDKIKPLIDQLTNLKCVDAVTNDNFEKKKAAWQPRVAGGNLLQVASKTKSKCALTKSKMTSFIETSHFLGTISLDAQFQTFTDRVAAERTHMNTLHDSCTARVKNTFDNEVGAATEAYDGKFDIISAAQDTSNKLLVTTLEGLVATNEENVQAKFEKIADPLAAKELAASALADATSALKTKTETKNDEKVLAEAAHGGALASALATKNDNAADRKEALRALKGIASTTHDEDKAFVDGYCTESKEDLKKEEQVLKLIEQKLGGLLVTKDDKVGKDAEDAETTGFTISRGKSQYARKSDDRAPATGKAWCRCAKADASSAISVCTATTPYGTYVTAHRRLAGVTDNEMTFTECKAECASHEMEIPRNQAQVAKAINTGCDSNNNKIWAQ